MTSSNDKTPVTAPSSASAVPTSESNRTKSIATRLTDAEFAEIESAAANAGTAEDPLEYSAAGLSRAIADEYDSLLNEIRGTNS